MKAVMEKLGEIKWLATLVFLLIIGIMLSGIGQLIQAEAIDKSKLTDLTVTIKQDGNEIIEGGTITSTKPIRIDISFGVPVEGDDPTPDNPIKKGDTVTFDLSNAFTVSPSENIPLKMGTIIVGHAQFVTDTDGMVTATVTFDGDISVFNGDSRNVTAQFGGNFEYDDSGSAGDTGNHTVTILEKTYTVNVPPCRNYI